MHDCLALSGVEIAAHIREGRMSSREAVETHIDEIRRVNPRLNAVVVERFTHALREADRCDAAVAAGEPLGPLHGVPCTIKEAFAFAGLPNTSGLPARRGQVASQDATAVKRLREAGAVCLGLTNISELCMWMESNNRVYGRCNNPYDPRRIVGGSSGGEGSIVGAGASPFGLGADIGGSIRLPAFFCGTFGHKPTGGAVPGTGQFPIAQNDALSMLATGPITRRAADLMPLLRILAGPDGEDVSTRVMSWPDPADVSLEGMKVILVEDDGRNPVADSLRSALGRAARGLSQLGAKVETRRFEGLRRAFLLWAARMNHSADTSFSSLLGNGAEISLLGEVVRFATGRSAHTLPALGLAALERVPTPDKTTRSLLAEARELRDELESAMGDGVILYPPYSRPAPLHNAPLLLTTLHFTYTGIFNVLEFPGTAVPMGLDNRGVPLGIQVVGPRGADHKTIAVAEALEQLFGGWIRPS